MASSNLRRRGASVVAAGAFTLALAACGSASTGVYVTHRPVAAPQTSSASPTARPSSSADLALPEVPGYEYVEMPEFVDPAVSAVEASELASAVVGQGAQIVGKPRTLMGVLLVQYTPSLTRALDAAPPDVLLDSVVAGIQGQMSGKITETDKVIDGRHVRVARTATVTFAVAYFSGGRLLEVAGQTPSSVLAFMTAYLGANPV
jgi:hypothetical protein